MWRCEDGHERVEWTGRNEQCWVCHDVDEPVRPWRDEVAGKGSSHNYVPPGGMYPAIPAGPTP